MMLSIYPQVRRELCQLFSLGPGAREDVDTPLPSRKMFRSLSMREATRLRHRAQLGHRHSFMGPGAGAGAGSGLGKGAGRGRHKGGVCQPGDCLESQTLLLSLTPSSTDSSARSSFSGAGAGQGAGAGHPRHVTLVTQRQEASC